MSQRWGAFITESIENDLFVALVGERSRFLDQIVEHLPTVVPGLRVKHIDLNNLDGVHNSTDHLESLVWVVRPHDELRSTMEVYKEQAQAISSLIKAGQQLVRVILPQKHEQDIKDILSGFSASIMVVQEMPEDNELVGETDLTELLNNLFRAQDKDMVQYISVTREIGPETQTSSKVEQISAVVIPPRPEPLTFGYEQPSFGIQAVTTQLFSHLPEEKVVRPVQRGTPAPQSSTQIQQDPPAPGNVEHQVQSIEKNLYRPQTLPPNPQKLSQQGVNRSQSAFAFDPDRGGERGSLTIVSEKEKEQERRLAQLFVSKKESSIVDGDSRQNEASDQAISKNTLQGSTEEEQSQDNQSTKQDRLEHSTNHVTRMLSRLTSPIQNIFSGFSHDLPIQVRVLLLAGLFVAGVIGGYVAVQATATAQIRTIVTAFTDEYSSSSSFNPDTNYSPASLLLIRGYEKVLVTIALVYGWIRDPLALTGILRDIEITRVFLSTIDEQQELKKNTTIAYTSMLGKEQRDPLEQIAQIRVQIEAYIRTLGQTSSLIRDQGASGVLGMYSPADLDRELSTTRVDLLKAQYFLDVLPEILGATQKKTYAVLIQNPLEIRSSGGFLESIVFITFDKGYLLDVQVQDVTILDSQLRGRVDPPQDLQRVLGEESWYLRDANWSPSFPAIASQTSWFVEKQLGRSIDGVIAMNTHTLRELIRVLGPVELGDETLTPENLFERLFAKSELLLATNDSIEKKGFVSQITQQIISKLQADEREEVISSALQVIFRSLLSGQSMMSTNDPQVERALLLLSMNGEVYQPQCPQLFAEKYCVVETIYHLDSNVGVNRANHFVSRDIKHDITLSGTGADHSYVVRYVNTAPNGVWPSGVYKNYMRLVLPEYSQVGAVTVNGRLIQPEDYIIEIVGGKRSIGWLLEVPVGGSTEIVVRYRSAFTTAQEFSYALFRQHQAGIIDPHTKTTIEPAQEMRVIKVAPSARVSAGSIEFEQLKPEHTFYAVELQEM